MIKEPKELIYLFKDLNSCEDAIVNWFGDLFDDKTILSLIEVTLWIRDIDRYIGEISYNYRIYPSSLRYLGDFKN